MMCRFIRAPNVFTVNEAICHKGFVGSCNRLEAVRKHAT
jgi:hypothetical protein